MSVAIVGYLDFGVGVPEERFWLVMHIKTTGDCTAVLHRQHTFIFALACYNASKIISAGMQRILGSQFSPPTRFPPESLGTRLGWHLIHSMSIPCRLTIVFLSYRHFLVMGTPWNVPHCPNKRGSTSYCTYVIFNDIVIIKCN